MGLLKWLKRAWEEFPYMEPTLLAPPQDYKDLVLRHLRDEIYMRIKMDRAYIVEANPKYHCMPDLLSQVIEELFELGYIEPDDRLHARWRVTDKEYRFYQDFPLIGIRPFPLNQYVAIYEDGSETVMALEYVRSFEGQFPKYQDFYEGIPKAREIARSRAELAARQLNPEYWV